MSKQNYCHSTANALLLGSEFLLLILCETLLNCFYILRRIFVDLRLDAVFTIFKAREVVDREARSSSPLFSKERVKQKLGENEQCSKYNGWQCFIKKILPPPPSQFQVSCDRPISKEESNKNWVRPTSVQNTMVGRVSSKKSYQDTEVSHFWCDG